MTDDFPTLTFMRADWMADAACRGLDPNYWHPPKQGSNHNTPKAKEICAGCPVRSECLQFAMDNGETRGIWGGVSIAEHRRAVGGFDRNAWRRQRAGAPSAPRTPTPIVHGTLAGYVRERRAGEGICDECRTARNAHRKARRDEGLVA